MVTPRFVFGLLVLFCLVLGCGNTTPVPPAQLSPAQQEQKQIAVKAKEAMFNQLLARLEHVISTGGPANAIHICKSEAPLIAAKVGKDFNVAIGRTSVKLRNPKNGPPDWAKPMVQMMVTDEQAIPLPGGRLGVLMPIFLKDKCLACHGPEDALKEEVKMALKNQYPEDQATGYREKDLRGWFWVEVPPQSVAN